MSNVCNFVSVCMCLCGVIDGVIVVSMCVLIIFVCLLLCVVVIVLCDVIECCYFVVCLFCCVFVM